LLARHGQTDWNRDGRFQGHADPPLNAHGREQARALAKELEQEPLAAVYASDLQRSAQTAQIVAEGRGLPVVSLPELREIDVGEWSGLTVDEIIVRYPDGYRRHREGGDGWTQGETHAELTTRIVRAVCEIAPAHPGETILIVGHGAALRALLAHAEGVDLGEFRRTRPPVENGALVSIVAENGSLRRID
jgi:broad specificity phosphatase PhoE